MNKTEFVERIVSLLDRGSEPMVTRRVADRLADARLAAVRAANQRQSAAEAGGFGAIAARLPGFMSPAGAGMAGLALVALTWAMLQWQSPQRSAQPESIDLALLVDEAPLSAYTRADFASCLNRTC